MENLEKMELSRDKTADLQKWYNQKSKGAASLFGRNLTLFLCILVPFLLVGFIWTEFGPVSIGPMLLSDGILTVSLFIVGELMMTKLGADGGKLDPEYLSAKEEFERLRKKAGEIGFFLMGIFCDWQIDLEMENAVHTRLRMLRITPEEWEEIKTLPRETLERTYGKAKAKKLTEIRNLKPIALNEAILLYDGDRYARGGVPVSAEEYLHSKAHFIKTLLACIFMGLLTVSVVITMTSDVTFARVIYTVFKLVMLMFRMASGYARGAKAYHTVEVKQYRARANYLRSYIQFAEDKIYLKLGDQYGGVPRFLGNEG